MLKLNILAKKNKNFRRGLIYLFFTSTLFIGLILDENSSGGGKIDFQYLFFLLKNLV